MLHVSVVAIAQAPATQYKTIGNLDLRDAIHMFAAAVIAQTAVHRYWPSCIHRTSCLDIGVAMQCKCLPLQLLRTVDTVYTHQISCTTSVALQCCTACVCCCSCTLHAVQEQQNESAMQVFAAAAARYLKQSAAAANVLISMLECCVCCQPCTACACCCSCSRTCGAVSLHWTFWVSGAPGQGQKMKQP